MNTLKRFTSPVARCLRLAVLLLIAGSANAQVAFSPSAYSGWNSTTQAFATVPSGTGITFSQISRGSGLGAPAPVTSGITSNGWDGTTSAATAVAANKFFTFSITANASTSFDVTGMVLALQRSTTGPGSFEMEYSVNSGPYAVFGSPFSSSSSSTFTQTLSPATAVVVPAGGNVVFRLVGWNASGSTGTFRINNNTAVNGNTYGVTSIATTSVTGAPFCVSTTSGAAATVSYSATGSFTAGNVFTAQLSDASGSFASPVTIGTLTGNANTGTITATIPAGTTFGTGYRVRVTASAPNTTGTDNGADLSVIQGIGFSYSVSAISCNGMNDGAITTSLTEGIAPITYAWSNSSTATSVSGLSAGTYSLTMTSANGCSGIINAVTLTDPAVLSTTSSSANVSCNGGNNGSANLTTTGGTTPYTFAWSNTATSQNISGLSAGTYSVLITDSHGCTNTQTVTITQPTALVASTTTANVTCNGSSNGGVTLSVSGGTPNYSYSWSNTSTSQNLSNVPAGNYSVTITDNNSCTQTASVIITEPTALAASTTITNVTCNGSSNGGVTLSVSGGTPNYSYSWSNASTSQNLSNVPAGNYSVTITDNNSCTQTASVTITEPTALVASTAVTNVTCNGNSNGGVMLSVSGGTPNYSYSWSNASTSQNLSNVPAGNYSVTITDNNSCTQTASVTITEPAALVASTTIANVTCNGNSNGGVTLSVSGGTPNYSYSWSNASTSQNLSNVPAGNYSVTITDNNNCTQTASVTVTEPAALTASTIVSNAICNGSSNGDVTLSVSGGTPNYSYSWSNASTSQNLSNIPAGNYSVTITDNNSCMQTASVTVTEPSAIAVSTTSTNPSCNGSSNGSVLLSVTGGTPNYSYNWSNTSTSQNLSNAAAGNYSVTITDSHGCTQTTSVTLTEPAALVASTVVTNVLCNGSSNGGITLSVSGGTPNYSYSWSNASTSQNLSNVPAGNYSVTITDNNGCTQTASVSITEPATLSSSIVSTMASCGACADGSADLSVNGGTAPYSYAWSNAGTTEDLVNVLPGTYTVMITDANGCTQQDTVTVNFSTGIETVTTGNNFTLYPNPSNGEAVHIVVNENTSIAGELLFIVSDITGKEVYRSTMNGSLIVSLPLADGAYFYRIEDTKNLLQSGRLLIAH